MFNFLTTTKKSILPFYGIFRQTRFLLQFKKTAVAIKKELKEAPRKRI